MTNKYDAPSGAPPAYGTQQQHHDAGPASNIGSPYPPQQAHVAGGQYNSNYAGSPYPQYNSPHQQYASPQPQYHQGPYGPPQGPYYQQGPPMGYAPQQQPMYGPQGGGYYGHQQPGYYDNRGHDDGCMGALLASLACCCCLDACLLF